MNDNASDFPISEELFVNMPRKKLSWWECNVGTQPVTIAGPYHSHPILAGSRFVLERLACHEAQRSGVWVVDVGAAPKRTSKILGQNGHYLCPQLQPGDATRLRTAPVDIRDRVCTHRLEECGCLGDDQRALLFVHSAYYFDPLWLWSYLRRPEVVDCLVVGHVFQDAYGGFLDECTWEFDGPNVVMAVKGNLAPYHHAPLPWTVGWRGPNGECFQAEEIRRIGDFTCLWRVEADFGLPPVALYWEDVKTDIALSGPVQFSSAANAVLPDDARTRRITLDFQNVYKVGPVLYTFASDGEGTRRVTLPVNLVAVAANYCSNRERTPQLLQEVTHILRKRAEGLRVPPVLQAQAVSCAAVLGMVTNLHAETGTLVQAHRRYNWLYKAHGSLIKFENPFWNLRFLSSGLLVGGAALYMASYEAPKYFTVSNSLSRLPWLDPLRRVFIAMIVAGGCFEIAAKTYEFFDKWLYRFWRARLEAPNPVTSKLPPGAIPKEVAEMRGTTHIRPPLQDSEVVGVVKLLPTEEKPDETVRCIVSGLVEPTVAVNVLRPTQEAELSAVTNRILGERPNPEMEAVQALADFVKTHRYFKPPGKVDLSENAFTSWAHSLRQYPLQYRNNLIAVWKEHFGTRPKPVPTKPFLKLEKSAATVQLDGQKPTKPRLIQPPGDEDKAMTGAVSAQLADLLRKLWDGVQCPIVYASGYTSDYIGARVDDFLARHEKVRIIGYNVDQSGFDSTLSIFLQDAVFNYYYAAGVTANVIPWYTRIRTRGVTPHGVKYEAYREWKSIPKDLVDVLKRFAKKYDLKITVTEVEDDLYDVTMEDFQMTSGRSDTNLLDSLVTGGAFACPLSDHNVDDYLLLVCGDDAFLLITEDSRFVLEEIERFQRRLGLKPESKVCTRRCDWEFCSRLFWWGRDPATGLAQTVLGPKPGRGIARMGWSSTKPGAQNIASSALSIRVDGGHVPFLRVVAERVYELCREAKMKAAGREWEAMRASKRFDCVPQNFTLCVDRYGLDAASEYQLSAVLADCTCLPAAFEWEPLAEMARIDET